MKYVFNIELIYVNTCYIRYWTLLDKNSQNKFQTQSWEHSPSISFDILQHQTTPRAQDTLSCSWSVLEVQNELYFRQLLKSRGGNSVCPAAACSHLHLSNLTAELHQQQLWTPAMGQWCPSSLAASKNIPQSELYEKAKKAFQSAYP